MAKLKLTIAYDGRAFSGWQSQPNKNTIQDILNTAIAEISKKSIQVQGSGRTDAGVHADGQVAHFEPPTEVHMNPYNWVPALNTKLPPAIRILDCSEMPDDFHARFSAIEKTYVYDLCLAPVLHPHRHGRAWHLPRQLDPLTLEQALHHYIGKHCFRAFAANRGNETEDTDYTRSITRSEFKNYKDGYRITFTGDGFLYKMVRLMTGAAVQAAQGRLRLDDHLSLLNQTEDLPFGKSPYCAPPDGLTLSKVSYE